jgi:hypothetical protein
MNTRTPEVERVVRSCERYWKRTGVPRGRIAEMRAELETHLHEAAGEGKSMDSVVGSDVTAFAEGWAREFRPPMVMSRRRAWGPALLAFLAGMFTLWASLSIPVSFSGGAEVCCPRRVIESTSQVDVTSLVLALILVASALLAMISSFLLALGRLTGASVTLGIAAALGALQPFTWVAALALIGCFAWTQWFRRRQVAVVPEG